MPSFFAVLSAAERTALCIDVALRTPRSPCPLGQRYNLPFPLTCPVVVLLCDCNALDAVGRWTRDQRALLTRVCDPRQRCTLTSFLYPRLLPRLSAPHLDYALASWVRQTRPCRDREPRSLDGKTVWGARTATQSAAHLLSFLPHYSQETLLPVRVDDKTNEIPVARAVLPLLPVRGRVVTTDAQHTQSALAQVIHACDVHYLFMVKDNQPRPRAELMAYCPDPHAAPAPPEFTFMGYTRAWFAYGHRPSVRCMLSITTSTLRQRHL